MARRSSNSGAVTRSYGTTTVLGRVKSAPATVSLGFQTVTVPTYTPGAVRADARYTTGISVSRAPATTVAGTASQGTLLLSRNCAARRPATWRTWNDCTVSPGSRRASRGNAAETPAGTRTTEGAPRGPPTTQRRD